MIYPKKVLGTVMGHTSPNHNGNSEYRNPYIPKFDCIGTLGHLGLGGGRKGRRGGNGSTLRPQVFTGSSLNEAPSWGVPKIVRHLYIKKKDPKRGPSFGELS